MKLFNFKSANAVAKGKVADWRGGTLPVVLGLLALLGIMIVQSLSVLHSLHAIEASYAENVLVNINKLRQLDEMLLAFQRRSVLLHAAVLTDDPFDRDVILLEHIALAEAYIEARTALELLQQDSVETELLRTLREINGQGYIYQQDVLAALQEGQPQSAVSAALSNTVRPNISQAYRTLTAVRDHVVKQAQHEEQRVQRLIAQGRQGAWISGIVAVLMSLFAVAMTVVRHRRQQDVLHWHATHDALTGLANRTYFDPALEQVVEDARRRRTHHGLLLLDLDRFKPVNDTYGHPAGDALLRGLASQLATVLRGNDTLARIGGDEFAVLARDCDATQLLQLGGRLLTAAQTFVQDWRGHKLSIGISIGAAAITPTCGSASEVTYAADQALYAAKHAGRGRLHVAQPAAVLEAV